MKYRVPGLRLSGTSFLLHAAYVSAVRFTAERCEDVALLMTEAGEGGRFLATPEEIREIGRILDGEGAGLHVHLPTDGDCETAPGGRALFDRVRRAIDRVAPLAPHSFVLHADFPSLRGTGRGPSEEQARETAELLRDVAACLPAPEMLAVENLEGFSPAFWDRWLDGAPFSRCLDIGHIWKDGGDPAPVLGAWLPRVRVIHLHGLRPRHVAPHPFPMETATAQGTGDGSANSAPAQWAGGEASAEKEKKLFKDTEIPGQSPGAQDQTQSAENPRNAAPGACGPATRFGDGDPTHPEMFPYGNKERPANAGHGFSSPETALLRRFGPQPRDHTSLGLMPAPLIDAVLHPLWRQGFAGALNLEVFNWEDFAASHAVIMASYARYAASGTGPVYAPLFGLKPYPARQTMNLPAVGMRRNLSFNEASL